MVRRPVHQLVHGATVDGIDLAERSVIAGRVHHRYQALVLACGASPSALPAPGGVTALQLRSLADATRLRQASAQADSAVVIGAGFIGCEAAASLSLQGVTVTLVAPEAAPQIERLGPEASECLVDLLSQVGVRFVCGVAVEAIDGGVRLDNGVTIDTDLVLAATGVRPQSGLAEAAGLTVSQSRIVVGPDMATSADDVYAAGDVALAFQLRGGTPSGGGARAGRGGPGRHRRCRRGRPISEMECPVSDAVA